MKELTLGRNGVAGGFKFGTGFVLAAALIGTVIAVATGKGNGSSMGQWKHLGGGVRTRTRILGVKQLFGADIAKQPGSQVTVGIAFSVDTRDFQNNPIAWPYLVAARLDDAATGNIIMTACDALNCTFTNRLPGDKQVNIPLDLPSNIAPGRYNVLVTLFGANSDASGTPDPNQGSTLDIATAPDQVVVGGGASTPGGSISNVTVSQGRRHALRRS